MGEHGEELVLAPVRRLQLADVLLRLGVEAGVVERQGRPLPHVLGEGEVGGAVAPLAVGEGEGESAEHPAVGHQRHQHGGGGAQPQQQLQVMLVLGGGADLLLRDLRRQDGLAGAQDEAHAGRRSHLRRIALPQLLHDLAVLGIAAGYRGAPDLPALVEDVEDGEVGELLHHQLRQEAQHLLVVERGGELTPELGEQSETPGALRRVPALGDVAAQHPGRSRREAACGSGGVRPHIVIELPLSGPFHRPTTLTRGHYIQGPIHLDSSPSPACRASVTREDDRPGMQAACRALTPAPGRAGGSCPPAPGCA